MSVSGQAPWSYYGGRFATQTGPAFPTGPTFPTQTQATFPSVGMQTQFPSVPFRPTTFYQPQFQMQTFPRLPTQATYYQPAANYFPSMQSVGQQVLPQNFVSRPRYRFVLSVIKCAQKSFWRRSFCFAWQKFVLNWIEIQQKAEISYFEVQRVLWPKLRDTFILSVRLCHLRGKRADNQVFCQCWREANRSLLLFFSYTQGGNFPWALDALRYHTGQPTFGCVHMSHFACMCISIYVAWNCSACSFVLLPVGPDR